MHYKKILILPVMIVILLAACTQSDIFYQIENEEKIIDSNLSNSLSGFSMFKNNNFYYLQAGTAFYKKGLDETDWLPIPPPNHTSGSEIFASSALVFNSIIYVVWNNIKEDSSRTSILYSYNEGDSTWNQTGISNSGSADSFSLFSLFSAGNDLLVQQDSYQTDSTGYLNLADSTQYLYQIGDNVALDNSKLISLNNSGNKQSMQVTGAAADANGTIWLSGTSLMKNETQNLYQFSNVTPGSLDDMDYCGIYIFGNLILAPCKSESNNNPIYYSFDGGQNWGYQPESDVRFSSFVKLPSSNIILAGTKSFIAGETNKSYNGNGYRELHIEGNSLTLTDNSFSDVNNYKSTDSGLYGGSINSFFLDPNPSSKVDKDYALFALTQGSGVWVNKTDESQVRKWFWE